MPVKILMNWDIRPEQEQDYFEFVIRDFIPGMQRMGFELSDAWVTVYGDRPQILVGAILPDLDQAHQALDSQEWLALNNQLMNFVVNFDARIVPARGGFQF